MSIEGDTRCRRCARRQATPSMTHNLIRKVTDDGGHFNKHR